MLYYSLGKKNWQLFLFKRVIQSVKKMSQEYNDCTHRSVSYSCTGFDVWFLLFGYIFPVTYKMQVSNFLCDCLREDTNLYIMLYLYMIFFSLLVRIIYIYIINQKHLKFSDISDASIKFTLQKCHVSQQKATYMYT